MKLTPNLEKALLLGCIWVEMGIVKSEGHVLPLALEACPSLAPLLVRWDMQDELFPQKHGGLLKVTQVTQDPELSSMPPSHTTPLLGL